ncbi:MAG: hypothetical protein ACO3EZ_08985 [Prochlorotrichaceae cyanobacterium]
MVSIPLLDQVALALAQDEQQQRIKKLLICNCYGKWEAQPEKVDSISWRQLLVDTLERSPTLDALNLQLNQLAKTLSKPVEYAHVANQIIEIVQELYHPRSLPRYPAPPELEDATQWFSAPQPEASEHTQLVHHLPPLPPPPQINPQDLALHRLQTFPDAVRLKKLTYCLCYHQWPQDEHYLAAVTWSQLLQLLLELVPNSDHLRYLIQQIAQSISKPQEYLQLGNVLWDIVSPLYQNTPVSISPQANSPCSLSPSAGSPPTEIAAPITQVTNAPGVQSCLASEPSQPQPVESAGIPSYDRYETRVEIMKYTNPFMAKLLIFSLLYEPIDLQQSNWGGLNQASLDDLLECLVEQCTTQSLKRRLTETAKRLPQTDLARQAAATIFRVLKPYCRQDGNDSQSMAEHSPKELNLNPSNMTTPLFPSSR